MRQLLRLAILQPFLAISCQPHKYISQNLGADGHFKVLSVSKSQLDQNLWHKSQFWKKKIQNSNFKFFDHLWSFLVCLNLNWILSYGSISGEKCFLPENASFQG